MGLLVRLFRKRSASFCASWEKFADGKSDSRSFQVDDEYQQDADIEVQIPKQ